MNSKIDTGVFQTLLVNKTGILVFADILQMIAIYPYLPNKRGKKQNNETIDYHNLVVENNCNNKK